MTGSGASHSREGESGVLKSYPPSRTAAAHFVDTFGALQAACSRMKNARWIALDTEFMQATTYFAQLSLIQVASESGFIAVIDPLSISDLSPLLDLLFDHSITKVLHSPAQDLKIFFHLYDRVPSPVFDTQLAASVLGIGTQVGYGALVRQMLGVNLDKSLAMTNWNQRPLDASQVSYAADDVRFLLEVYPLLLEELEKLNRLDWIRPDLASFSDPVRYAIEPQNAWRRIRGSRSLKPHELPLLQALAAWRENRAVSINKPRNWVLNDDVILEIARRCPPTVQDLGKIRGISDRIVDVYGDTVLTVLDSAKSMPESEWPLVSTQRALTASENALVDAMMSVVRMCADENRITPALLATRKDLEAVLLVGEDIDDELELLQGWRRQLVGTRLQAFLRGEFGLYVRDGAICASPTDEATL